MDKIPIFVLGMAWKSRAVRKFRRLFKTVSYMLGDFKLDVFMAVAQQRSFTKAAAELGISQPAVSQNIADLEKLTGVRLFDRQRGEVLLTPAGEVFKAHAVRMLASCAEADTVFSALQPATVRISVSEELYSLYVLPALEKFMVVHPEIVFDRVMFDDADLKVSLRHSSEGLRSDQEEVIARVRTSFVPASEMGALADAHELVSYFDVVFHPSAAFACTKLCRVLKEMLTLI